MTTETKSKPKPQDKDVQVLLHIRSRGPRRRRADINFTRQGATFTAEQLKGKLKTIKADPQLVITEVKE